MSNIVRRKKELGGGNGVFKRWNEWSEGDFIVGTYLGTKIDKVYNKPMHSFKIVEMGLANPLSSISKKQTEADRREITLGMTISLNSSGLLDKHIGEISEGDMLEIIYRGTDVLPSNHKYSGKDCHQFEVYLVETEEDSSDCL